jgi:hypothetical protein
MDRDPLPESGAGGNGELSPQIDAAQVVSRKAENTKRRKLSALGVVRLPVGRREFRKPKKLPR